MAPERLIEATWQKVLAASPQDEQPAIEAIRRMFFIGAAATLKAFLVEFMKPEDCGQLIENVIEEIDAFDRVIYSEKACH